MIFNYFYIYLDKKFYNINFIQISKGFNFIDTMKFC